jgi:hypothetical protein
MLVGRSIERVEEGGLPSGVEAEGDLVAVHHDIGNLAVATRRVGDLATQEDTSIGVHGGLVLGHGLVQLPQNDALGVVEQVLANTRNVLDDGDAEVGQLLLGTQTGQQHQAGSIDCASAEDGLGTGVERALGAVLEGDVDASDLVASDVDLADPGVCKDGEVGSLLVTPQDGVDVGNTGTASAAVVGVVGDGEEADRGLEGTGGLDLLVEVMDDGNVHGLGARVDPVEAELVAVPLVDGLDRVAEVVKNTHERLEAPALAALRLPPLEIVLERAEGDEGVV